MRSQFVRCVMGIGLLLLCADPVLGAQPACAKQLNRWEHWLRHDWDGDGTPENKFVTCAFFDAETGWWYTYVAETEPPFTEFMCVCPDDHKTDAGNPYGHAHLNHSFPMIGLIGSVWKAVTASMEEAYWDWYYSGYSKVGTYSVSQNCYGHAFGTGTMVEDGMYGAEIIRVDDWDDADLYDAEVAYTESHAIKVTPKECFDEMTSWWILEASSEKNRTSAVYNQAEDCPDGVTLKDGPYEYYKKKTP